MKKEGLCVFFIFLCPFTDAFQDGFKTMKETIGNAMHEDLAICSVIDMVYLFYFILFFCTDIRKKYFSVIMIDSRIYKKPYMYS